jgi:hypothetical protein
LPQSDLSTIYPHNFYLSASWRTALGKTGLIKFLTLLSLTLLWGQPSQAASDFFSVLDAARSIVAGRTFQSEDGLQLAFGKIRRTSPARAELTVRVTFPSGSKRTLREVIIQEGHQVRLEQTEGRSRPIPFFISVDEPFHVLRIRPMDSGETEFLSRECLYQKDEEKHYCYIKSKVNGEVFVSVFVEAEACE